MNLYIDGLFSLTKSDEPNKLTLRMDTCQPSRGRDEDCCLLFSNTGKQL